MVLVISRDKTPALQQRMAIYDRVLEANLPDIHTHLKSVDVSFKALKHTAVLSL